MPDLRSVWVGWDGIDPIWETRCTWEWKVEL